MDFGEKLKEIRKYEGLSQEQLADKIGVSRQAITKWETGRGLPDMENMVILAEIFKVTIDELISQAMPGYNASVKKEMYTSETIYDIDCSKNFDIKLGCVDTISIEQCNDEKLHVKIESETIEDLNRMFKIKLDDNRNRLDVNCNLQKGLSRYEIGEAVSVHITLPVAYMGNCELAAEAKKVNLNGLNFNCLEYDGSADFVDINGCLGSYEFTGKNRFDITVDKLQGRIEVNQWKSTSVIHIPDENNFKVNNSGRKCSVFFQKNGERYECNFHEDVENELCIKGVGSEMIVDLF